MPRDVSSPDAKVGTRRHSSPALNVDTSKHPPSILNRVTVLNKMWIPPLRLTHMLLAVGLSPNWWKRTSKITLLEVTS